MIDNLKRQLRRRHWLTKSLFVGALAFLSLACNTTIIRDLVKVTPLEGTPIPISVEIVNLPTATPLPTETPLPAAAPTEAPVIATPTIVPVTPLATPRPTAMPRGFFSILNTQPAQHLIDAGLPYPRHGLIIAFLIPLIFFGIPWAILEVGVARYVQPRGIDLTGVLIKAQDGLFIEAIVSMTARKTLSLVSLTIQWYLVRDVVEKAVEQELIHQALTYSTLPELENNLRNIAERLTELPVILELSRDFGVDVIRFNIEIRYPSETVDAINRKAEANAGGQAFIAYARAAHLDPDSAEARELYEVFQQTSSQVDAARNLGGGITNLASLLSRRRALPESDFDDESEA